jgi:hypothetical protein
MSGSLNEEFVEVYQEALTEALKVCLSQVPEFHPNDEYRRGQYRGATDCVEMVRRLIDPDRIMKQITTRYDGDES